MQPQALTSSNSCYHKKRFADICLENGLYAPKFSKNLADVVFPAVVRSTLNSYGGKGINVVKTMEELQKVWTMSSWWTPYVYMKKEYRAIIVDGKVIKVFEKVLPDNYNEEFPIRNNEITHWSIRNVEKFDKLKIIAEKLKEVFGKFFIGLDVGLTDNGYIIIEGNSALGINSLTAKLIADGLEINFENYRTRKIN